MPPAQPELARAAFRAMRAAPIFAILSLIVGCSFLSQRGQPSAAPSAISTPAPTPTPVATPTPEAEATPASGDVEAEEANEAEQKAKKAAKKAEEAAAAAAEASSAAHDAATAAAKAVAASRHRSGATPHKTAKSTASPRSSASPSATPTATVAEGSSTSSPETGLPASADEAGKAIDQVAQQLKATDRTQLPAADTQRYDIATGLLNSARKALSNNDYMAATSLAGKARVLLNGIGH
ncbi:MAG: hypothetical protein ACLQAT_14510 [Candidatus Binataceae bacterium]